MMPPFPSRDPQSPATLQAVLEAVVQLSALDESEFLALASSRKLGEVFPFRPSAPTEPVATFASDSDLTEASPQRLSPKERAVLIQSSMPRHANHGQFFEVAGMPESLDVLVREMRSLEREEDELARSGQSTDKP